MLEPAIESPETNLKLLELPYPVAAAPTPPEGFAPTFGLVLYTRFIPNCFDPGEEVAGTVIASIVFGPEASVLPIAWTTYPLLALLEIEKPVVAVEAAAVVNVPNAALFPLIENASPGG